MRKLRQAGCAAREPIAVKLPDFSRWGKIEKVSLRGVRRKTAEHLALAWNVDSSRYAIR